jgi:hypothetical protein
MGVRRGCRITSSEERSMSGGFVRKASLLALALILGGVGLWATRAAAPATVVRVAPAPVKKEEPRLRDRDFRAALGRVYDFKGIDDKKTTLSAALKPLADKSKIPFAVNRRAFEEDGLADVLNCPVAEKAALEPMKAPLAAVLKKLLARVPVRSGAYFVIRRDAVEITTGRALREELNLARASDAVLSNLVWEEVLDERLIDALQRVAEWADVTVFVDPRARLKAAAKVTVTLRNLPVEQALEALAEQARLVVVEKGNAYYVTTKGNAALIRLGRHGGRELRDKLAREIDFKGYDDPKMNVIEALNQLSDRYNVSFDVNERAFRAEKMDDVLRRPITEKDPLPPMGKTTLAAVLKKILERVPVRSGATFLIRRGGVEITTGKAVREELKLPEPAKDARPEALPPILWEEIENQPLRAALRVLALAADTPILLDPRAKEKAATKVSAQLWNVSLEAAVELLADMAGLAVVRKSNAYYVTTPENAERLGKSDKKPLTGRR